MFVGGTAGSGSVVCIWERPGGGGTTFARLHVWRFGSIKRLGWACLVGWERVAWGLWESTGVCERTGVKASVSDSGGKCRVVAYLWCDFPQRTCEKGGGGYILLPCVWVGCCVCVRVRF